MLLVVHLCGEVEPFEPEEDHPSVVVVEQQVPGSAAGLVLVHLE